MCDQFGTCCQLCAKGIAHPKTPSPKQKAKKAEFWRKHNHLALEVGANQVAAMDAHYAKHGIHVGHRPKRDGTGYEPACVSKRDFDRCLAARGMVDQG